MIPLLVTPSFRTIFLFPSSTTIFLPDPRPSPSPRLGFVFSSLRGLGWMQVIPGPMTYLLRRRFPDLNLPTSDFDLPRPFSFRDARVPAVFNKTLSLLFFGFSSRPSWVPHFRVFSALERRIDLAPVSPGLFSMNSIRPLLILTSAILFSFGPSAALGSE